MKLDALLEAAKKESLCESNEAWEDDHPNLSYDKVLRFALANMKRKTGKTWKAGEEEMGYYDGGIDLITDDGDSVFVGVFPDHLAFTDESGKVVEVKFEKEKLA